MEFLFFSSFLSNIFSLILAGPSLSNADFWFMPNNYSVGGTLVKAVYVEGAVCQVDTDSLSLAKGSPLLLGPFSPHLHLEKLQNPTVLPFFLLLINKGNLLFFVLADFLAAGCHYYDETIAAVKLLQPAVSIYESPGTTADIGYITSELYGYLATYQKSGLALTLINNGSAIQVLRAMNAEPSLTAFITAGQFFSCQELCCAFINPSLYEKQQQDVGNWLRYAQTPSFEAFVGLNITIYVSQLHWIGLRVLTTFLFLCRVCCCGTSFTKESASFAAVFAGTCSFQCILAFS